MGDDGIGIRVVDTLRKDVLPPDIGVYDAGTRAFDVLEYMDGNDKAIIVDAYQKNGVPGSIYRFIFDPEIPDDSLNLSLHDIDFISALKAGRETYNLPPEIVVIGIEPEILEWGIGLSPSLSNAFPGIMDAVMSELSA